MNPPKVFWAAAVFALVLIGAGFFILQSTGFAQAQGKITGTIVLNDTTGTMDYTMNTIALPGTTCTVTAVICGTSVAYNPIVLAEASNDFESSPSDNISHIFMDVEGPCNAYIDLFNSTPECHESVGGEIGTGNASCSVLTVIDVDAGNYYLASSGFKTNHAVVSYSCT